MICVVIISFFEIDLFWKIKKFLLIKLINLLFFDIDIIMLYFLCVNFICIVEIEFIKIKKILYLFLFYYLVLIFYYLVLIFCIYRIVYFLFI